MSSSSEEIVDDGAEAVDERGVGGAVRSLLIGGSIMALATTVVEVITGIPGTFLAPLTAFADGLATLIGGTLGAPIRITDAGSEASAESFLSGAAAALGPAAFPVAVLVSVVGLWLFLRFLQEISISPLQLLRDNED
jgi:hypothetical protein